jgi:hypothetical protein
MFEAFGNHAESEGLHAGDRFIPVLPVGHDAGQGRYFGEPTAIIFALNFNRERHGGNVPSGPAVQQGDGRTDTCRSANRTFS